MDIHKHQDTPNPLQRLIDKKKKTQWLSPLQKSTYKDRKI